MLDHIKNTDIPDHFIMEYVNGNDVEVKGRVSHDDIQKIVQTLFVSLDPYEQFKLHQTLFDNMKLFN